MRQLILNLCRNGLEAMSPGTKDDGTGLGLAVCYSISARHNANIDAMSTSEGTTFSVRFKLIG